MLLNRGGLIIYFGESFTISVDMLKDLWKIVVNVYGLKKL